MGFLKEIGSSAVLYVNRIFKKVLEYKGTLFSHYKTREPKLILIQPQDPNVSTFPFYILLAVRKPFAVIVF